MEDLRLEVAILKSKTKKSYKTIAEESGISYGCLYKFTSGARNLTEENQKKLIAYLSTFDNKD